MRSGLARPGAVGSGEVRCGMVRQLRHGGVGSGAAWLGRARFGRVG